MPFSIKYHAYQIIGEDNKVTIQSNEMQASILFLFQDSILVKTKSDLSLPKYSYLKVFGSIESQLINDLSNQLKKEIKEKELIYLGKSSVANNIIENSTDLYLLNLKKNDIDIMVDFEKVRIDEYCKKIINGEIHESESVHSYFLAKNKGLI